MKTERLYEHIFHHIVILYMLAATQVIKGRNIYIEKIPNDIENPSDN